MKNTSKDKYIYSPHQSCVRCITTFGEDRGGMNLKDIREMLRQKTRYSRVEEPARWLWYCSRHALQRIQEDFAHRLQAEIDDQVEK